LKKIYIVFLVVALLLSGVIYFLLTKVNINNVVSGKIVKNKEIKKVEVKKQTKEEIKNLSKNKLNTLRKRYSYKWLIMSWDMHMNNDEYILALQNYLEVLRWNTKDKQIIKKIGDTYFSMKKFDKAYLYYSKIKDYKSIDKNKAILSMLYWKELSSVNIPYFYKEIDSFNLSEEYNFYYKNSIFCLDDFHKCKLKFNEYFDKYNSEIDELKNIKSSIDHYRNFQLQELYYKNTLMIWAFFENALYPISVKLWKDVLKNKPGYKSLLQIIAKSYYQLWQYNFAKKYLADYYALASDDLDAIYMIWVVKMKLKDYLISNIFFEKLLKKGYKNILDVKKNMIFNYYKLDDTKKMLSMFKSIVGEKNVSSWDISLAIYYHIINWEIDYAKILTEKYIEIYPKYDMFYAYLGWIDKEKLDIVNAEINLKKALSLYPDNNLATFNMWLLEIIKWNNLVAKLYFKKTIKTDAKWEYWTLAQKELDKLSIQQ